MSEKFAWPHIWQWTRTTIALMSLQHWGFCAGTAEMYDVLVVEEILQNGERGMYRSRSFIIRSKLTREKLLLCTINKSVSIWHMFPLQITFCLISYWLLPLNTRYRIRAVLPNLDCQGITTDPEMCLGGDVCLPEPYCQKVHSDSAGGKRSRLTLQFGSSLQLSVANSTPRVAELGAPLSTRGPSIWTSFYMVEAHIWLVLIWTVVLLNLLIVAGFSPCEGLLLLAERDWLSLLSTIVAGLDNTPLRRETS